MLHQSVLDHLSFIFYLPMLLIFSIRMRLLTLRQLQCFSVLDIFHIKLKFHVFLYFITNTRHVFYPNASSNKHSPVKSLLVGCFWTQSLSWPLSSCLESDASCCVGEPCAQTHRTDLVFVSLGVLSMRAASWARR